MGGTNLPSFTFHSKEGRTTENSAGINNFFIPWLSLVGEGMSRGCPGWVRWGSGAALGSVEKIRPIWGKK